MANAFVQLVVLLVVSGIISYAGSLFLPDPFKKIANFVAALVAIYAVFVFIAYLLGVPVSVR